MKSNIEIVYSVKANVLPTWMEDGTTEHGCLIHSGEEYHAKCEKSEQNDSSFDDTAIGAAIYDR